MVNTAPDGILTFDSSGIVRSFNTSAEALFQIRTDEAIGSPVTRFVPELLSSSTRAPVSVAHTHLEADGRRADASTFPVEVTASRLVQDADVLYVAIVRDISERRRAEQAQRLFLAATSHDVRNALMVISAHAADLAEGQHTGESAGKIASVAHTVADIMNDIVAHAHLQEESAPLLRETSLAAFTADCGQDFASECRKKGLDLRIHFPADEIVLLDRPKLTRILHNLLANAVRYTQRGFVELAARLEPEHLLFTVRDSGIGIPADHLDHIFDDYYRHPQAREMQALGTGLGLATVRAFCHSLGGSVEVESRAGEGSTFTVRIPRGAPAARAESPDLPTGDSLPTTRA